MKYIISLIPKIFDYCSNSGYKSIAIPCLGCGTGGLKSYDVISLIESESKYYPELDITIYEKGAKETLSYNVLGENPFERNKGKVEQLIADLLESQNKGKVCHDDVL